jgi:hypothetical protein
MAPHGAAHLMVWGRGHTPASVEELAKAWDVNLFILGHEHVETGIEIKGPKLVLLNTDHKRGCVLPIDLADVPAAEEALLHVVPLAAVDSSGDLAIE